MLLVNVPLLVQLPFKVATVVGVRVVVEDAPVVKVVFRNALLKVKLPVTVVVPVPVKVPALRFSVVRKNALSLRSVLSLKTVRLRVLNPV